MRKCNVIRWLSAVTLAFLIVVSFTSCALLSSFESIRNTLTDDSVENTLTDKPGEFDRYLEYLYNINEEHRDEYDGHGYFAQSYPAYIGDEKIQYIVFAGCTNALGYDDGLDYSLITLLFVDEKDENCSYAFLMRKNHADGTYKDLVSCEGSIKLREYAGVLVDFEKFEDSETGTDDNKEHYLELVTAELNRLMETAVILIECAEIEPEALGFIWPQANQEESKVALSIQ